VHLRAVDHRARGRVVDHLLLRISARAACSRRVSCASRHPRPPCACARSLIFRIAWRKHSTSVTVNKYDCWPWLVLCAPLLCWIGLSTV
jgi:hypothetical protein